MNDDGALSDRVSEEADLELTWEWEPPVDGDDPSGAASFDPVSLEDQEVQRTPDSALPEDIWGAETADTGPGELELHDDAQFGDIWSRVGDDGAAALEDSLIFDPPSGNAEGLNVSVSSLATPAHRPAPRRPTLAPASRVDRRQSGLRGVLAGLGAAPRVAALALFIVATVGLLLALAARRPDTAPLNDSRQIDAAGLQSTSTLPRSTVPSTTLPPLTTLATSPESPPVDVAAPPATSASPPAAVTAATAPVTTAPPRSPARSEPATAPVVSPREPPPPAPPAVTVAPRPPETTLPPPPDTTVTTRRPRPTVPETTVAPSTTVPESDDPPADDD